MDFNFDYWYEVKNNHLIKKITLKILSLCGESINKGIIDIDEVVVYCEAEFRIWEKENSDKNPVPVDTLHYSIRENYKGLLIEIEKLNGEKNDNR